MPVSVNGHRQCTDNSLPPHTHNEDRIPKSRLVAGRASSTSLLQDRETETEAIFHYPVCPGLLELMNSVDVIFQLNLVKRIT